jgi:hypothetical protein
MGAGGLVIAAALARAMRQTAHDRHRETERKLRDLASKVKALQAREAEPGRLQAARLQEAEVPVLPAAAATRAVPKQEPVKPETLAVLTAAAAAFLNKKARIRSAKLVPAAQDGAGAWAQQGRVLVLTSHNLRSRG